MIMDNKIIIKDTDNQKNIFIQLDLKQGKTTVFSNFSAWENLAYLMEALGVTASICEDEGITKKEIYQAVNNYLTSVFSDYKLIINKKDNKK